MAGTQAGRDRAGPIVVALAAALEAVSRLAERASYPRSARPLSTLTASELSPPQVFRNRAERRSSLHGTVDVCLFSLTLCLSAAAIQTTPQRAARRCRMLPRFPSHPHA